MIKTYMPLDLKSAADIAVSLTREVVKFHGQEFFDDQGCQVCDLFREIDAIYHERPGSVNLDEAKELIRKLAHLCKVHHARALCDPDECDTCESFYNLDIVLATEAN